MPTSKSEFTVNSLIDAIRSADSLNELLHLVGPSEKDNEAARKRLEQIDRIGERYQYSVDDMPSHARETFERLNKKQTAFESKYA